MYINTTVCNGLNVEIYIQDQGRTWIIVAIAGRIKKWSGVQWLHKKIESDECELKRLYKIIDDAIIA